MNREEFLKVLKDSLTMSLEKDAIDVQLDYYDKYISDEIKKGRSEKEVIEELGDPRLIAKTIKTVNQSNDAIESNNYQNSGNSYGNDSYNDSNDYSERNRNYNNERSGKVFYGGTNGTIGCVIAGLVIFIIVYGILSFMGRLAYGVGELAFSGPLGLLLVVGLFWLLLGGRRR